MSKETGGQAFPRQHWDYDRQNNALKYQEDGMTLRDYFAAKAMQAWLTQIDPEEMEDMIERWAENSYELADCMLKVRKKQE
ncbi:hypothetical protein ACLEEJ_00415 [Lonsdalea quercina]|uniref:hypothetical protein n=1 Tax=Lonsdalea quercina TaxID=71657 RepID=UPI003975873E